MSTRTATPARAHKLFYYLSVHSIALAVAVCGAAGTLVLCRVVVVRERIQLSQRAEAEAKHVALQLQSGLLQRFEPLQRLAAWWLSQGRPFAAEDWQTDAQLFLSGGGLKEVTWVRSNGRLSWSVRPGAVPRTERFQPLAPELTTLVASARRLRSPVVSGLFVGEDGEALYACVPVTEQGRTLGYMVGLYRAAELLDGILGNQLPIDYSVQIVAAGRTIHTFDAPGAQWVDGSRTAGIPLPNAAWSVRIVPSESDIAGLRNLVLSFGGLITVLLYVCTVSWRISRHRALALAHANDALQLEVRQRIRTQEQVARLNRDLERRLADFQTLIDVAPIGIAVAEDPACSTIRVNPALARILGVAREQNISTIGPDSARLRFKFCRGGAELPGEALPMQVAARTGVEVIGEEVDILRADGRLVNTLSFAAPLFDEHGAVRGVLEACVDITERKQAEQALRDSEARYRVLTESLPQLVWTCRADGFCDYLSRQWTQYTGVREAEHLGNGWTMALHPEDRERAWATWQTAVRDGCCYDLEFRVCGADRLYRWFKTRAVPFLDSDGTIVKWFGTCTDVEDQKRAADETQALYLLAEWRAAQLAAVIESIPVAVYIGNTDALTHCNRVGLQLLGASRIDQLPNSFRAIAELLNLRWPNGRRLLNDELPYVRALKGETVVEEVIAAGGDSHAEVFLHMTAAPIAQDGKIAGVVWMNADITERRRLEQQLIEKQKLESIGLLAGGIAHDFNNLLCVIMGNASLALGDMPEGEGHQRLQAVVDAAESGANLTRQLLAYAGKGRFIIQPIDLSAHIREISSLLRTTISKAISLELELETGLPQIETDPGQIQQVIMNLLTNAAEAIGPGQGGTVRLATRKQQPVQHTAAQLPAGDMIAGPYVLLEVTDTGCGMDGETISRIFDPFFTTKATGRGLGLAAVAGFVRSHNGILQVDSTPGHGTVVRIWLPAMAGRSLASPLTEPDQPCQGTGTILVVEDEETIRAMTKNILQRHGYDVLLAENGQVALDCFARDASRIGLVLLDLTMPVMSGKETLARLRQIAGGVPIIVSSGYGEEEVVEQLDNRDAAAFIQKPYTASRLMRLIHDTLATAQAGQSPAPGPPQTT